MSGFGTTGLGKIFGGLMNKKTTNEQPKLEEPKKEQKIDLNLELVKEAKKWVGVKEKGGNNRGPEVEMFQKAVDGKASKEAWCMAFVQYCIKQIEHGFNAKSKVYKSEHCLTTYGNSPDSIKLENPEVGCVIIWRHGESSNGHTGIVTEIIDKDWVRVCEGNTGNPDDVVEREGDGVFLKKRSVHGAGEMKVWGYLKAF